MSLTLNRLPPQRVRQLLEKYRAALLDDVIPWWERHSLDRECGGYFSMLERDGHPFTTDKYMWTTGREIWMFSHLYNRHQPRPEWLAIARHGADFLLRHAFRDDGKMHFRLTREGKPRASVLSIYTECFGAIALAELSKAAGEPALWQRAVEMYDRIRPRLGLPTDTAMLGYPINAEFHLHAHDMIRITVAWVFDNLYPDARWKADLAMSVESLLEQALEARLKRPVGKRGARRLADARSFGRPHGTPRPRHRECVDADGHCLARRQHRVDGYGGRDRPGVVGARLGQGIRRHPLHHESGLDADAPAGSRSEVVVAALRGALCTVAGLGIHRA